ncbi:hypothetical protein TDB9533_00054 [Thalassocella blandensis]|nr:hypothetical protein TDB9533_00054 [Thalassocella blandensis]
MRNNATKPGLVLDINGVITTFLVGLLASAMVFSSQYLTVFYLPKYSFRKIIPTDFIFKAAVFLFGLIFFGSFGFHIANVIFF